MKSFIITPLIQINDLFKIFEESKCPSSASKALNSHYVALGFQAISKFLLSSEKFVVTNKVIFVTNIVVKKNLTSILYKILIYLNQ